ncbi:invasion protein [Nocardia sp. NPDC057030]|uniref:invasion protein n=1 Tax=unclassified Nocardia TaxID=2637762 RepID=UPI003634CEDE
MKTVRTVLGGVPAAEFLSLGTGAVPPTHERAAHLGYPTAGYRGIGAVGLVAAGGVLRGPVRPAIGRSGMVRLMIGAVAGPRRNGGGTTEIAPAAGTTLDVAATVTGGSR